MTSRGCLLFLLVLSSSSTSWSDDASRILVAASAGVITVGDSSEAEQVKPKSPQDALATLKIKPGYHVELVAAEPLIESPVAISFGADGRLWVAEMWDYPAGGTGQYEPGGRIRCLYDDNDDGRFDRSEVFLEGIPFPTGLTVWNKGLLICAAPDILYAEDTNADGKADVVRKLFSGFSTHNFHARVNSLEYGLDGWVYGACGGFGLKITSHVANTEFALGRRDFRMNPDTGAFEAVSGATQQGRVRNDWDDWFGCNNLVLLQHYPLNDQYLKRNPFLKLPPLVVGIAAGPDPGRLYSISDQMRFKLSGPPNRPTAVCGIGVYRDDLLGDEFSGNVFSCESVNNLVHRQILSPNGATFTGRRADDEKDCEFLASSDPWFRPVQARTGPDGGLWVVDMYRYVIEHPIWIPPETLAKLDTRAGADMGRIYRIVPDQKPRRTVPRLDQLKTEELVAALDSSNGTQRDIVQQLLTWQGERKAVPLLTRLITQSKRPEVRMQALCASAVLEQPSDQTLIQSLRDSHPGVRRHAVRLSEPRLNANADLAKAVSRLASDSDPSVQMQVAYSLGGWGAPKSAEALAELLVQSRDNSYLQAAVESSFSPTNVVAVLEALERRQDVPSSELIDQVYSQAAAVADPTAVIKLLQTLSKSATKTATVESIRRLASFLEACNRRGKGTLNLQSSFAVKDAQAAIASAMEIARDESIPLAMRLASVKLLGQGTLVGQNQIEFLLSLLSPRTPSELQSTVVAAIGLHDDSTVADSLLGHWNALSPAARKEVIPLLLSRPIWTTSLLAAVNRRDLSTTEFNLLQQQSLLNHPDTAIRTQAEQSFRSASNSTRQEIIDQYLAQLKNGGDATKGKLVFQKHCTACHRIQDLGNIVGPDVMAYGSKPAQALLIALFDPNKAVESRYQSYSVLLQDGRTATGLITEETATGLTLLLPEGKKLSVLRSEIDEMRNTGKTLMPEGFEKQISTEDVSDLWAYVQTWRTPPKTVPGNQPDLVEINNPKWVALRASQAEIFGDDVTFQPSTQSIVQWKNKADHIRWRIRSPKIMEFDVWCEWACGPDAAGSPFRLEVEDMVLTGVILSTGSSDKYQFQKVGMIRVREGESELVLRPGEDFTQVFADVRAVHLVVRGGVPEAAGRVERPGSNGAANSPDELALFLLDDRILQADREKKVASNLDMAAKAIPLMVVGLPSDAGSPEEYRRIPWIWRLSIGVSKTRKLDQIREVLSASMPKNDQRLEHWQAVVLGGGVINGISQLGEFPLPVILESFGNDQELIRRWQRSLELSVPMCDDEKVPSGTRYDALRMIGMLGWSRANSTLLKYLPKETNEELQLGAIGGINDIVDDAAGQTLFKNLSNFSGRNRRLSINTLLRSEKRCLLLLKAIEEKKVTADEVGPERIEKLLKHASEEVRQQATKLLSP